MSFIFENNSILNEVIVITPQVYSDERWFFLNSYIYKEFNKYWISSNFVQDNHSKSHKWVLRWFHFQTQNPQAKIIRAIKWSVLDFVIDIRKQSPTYWKYTYELLSGDNMKQIFIPHGFAHWFLTLEENTELLYKCDDYYNHQSEWWIIFTDRQINIDWELIIKEYNIPTLIVSQKDKQHPNLEQFYNSNPF